MNSFQLEGIAIGTSKLHKYTNAPLTKSHCQQLFYSACKAWNSEKSLSKLHIFCIYLYILPLANDISCPSKFLDEYGPSSRCAKSIGKIKTSHVRHWQIKLQFSYLRFKHPNILYTSDELSRSNFFSGVYHFQDTQDEKVRGDRPQKKNRPQKFIRST